MEQSTYSITVKKAYLHLTVETLSKLLASITKRINKHEYVPQFNILPEWDDEYGYSGLYSIEVGYGVSLIRDAKRVCQYTEKSVESLDSALKELDAIYEEGS